MKLVIGRNLKYDDIFEKLAHIPNFRRASKIPTGFPMIGNNEEIKFYRSLGDWAMFINCLRVIRNEFIE